MKTFEVLTSRCRMPCKNDNQNTKFNSLEATIDIAAKNPCELLTVHGPRCLSTAHPFLLKKEASP